MLERRQKAEAEFSQLVKQREQSIKQTEQADLRMAQLQGQYQVLSEQIAALEPEKKSKKAEVSPKANVIDATSVKGA